MNISIAPTRQANGRAAASFGAALLRNVIAQRNAANIIVATGASQFEMLDALVAEPGIAWEKVTVFHLDEYAGLPITHPASFRQYLWERFHRRLPFPVRAFHYVDAETDAAKECSRLGALIAGCPIDICFAGIGENAHLAFNDPPANFETVDPYIVVELDEACRRQQLGEGWFATLEEVPRKAISMSIRQLLKSRTIILTVPDQRKAEAVRASIEGPVTNRVPASVIQEHPDAHLFVDSAAASLLGGKED